MAENPTRGDTHRRIRTRAPKETTLKREQILEATEKVLRRYGPAKASVVDVARVLGVTHGAVYRHFPSKAALREAVTRQWIERNHEGLAELADDRALAASERLRHWLVTVFEAKRTPAVEDPELFETYYTLLKDQSDVVADHVNDLLAQIETIIREGMAGGEFREGDPRRLARAVFDATSRFHHPAHAGEWQSASLEEERDMLFSLLIRCLEP